MSAPSLAVSTPLPRGCLYRRLGEGAVAFSSSTWQTHILSPAAAAIFETLCEATGGEPLPLAAAREVLRHELALETDTPDMQRLLRNLTELGLILA